MSESEIERKVGLFCKANGFRYYKFTSPGRRAVPDRIILGPGGKVIFLELKAPGEKPRRLQLHEIAKLRELGHIAEWADNIQTAIEIITDTMLANAKADSREE